MLFVGADLLVLSIWKARKKIRLRGGRSRRRDRRPDHAAARRSAWPSSASARHIAIVGIVLGLLAAWLALPPVDDPDA